MKNFILLISKLNLIILLIVSCTFSSDRTTPSQILYATKKLEFSKKDIISNPKKMIENAEVMILPKADKNFFGVRYPNRKTFYLAPTDSLGDFGKFKSNYKVFKLKVESGKKYIILAQSACHCKPLSIFNFTKQQPYFGMMIPYVLLLDQNKQVIQGAKYIYKAIESKYPLIKQSLIPNKYNLDLLPSLNNPEGIRATVNFVSSYTGEYYLIFASETSHIGTRLVIGNHYFGTGLYTVGYPYTIDPYGKFQLGYYVHKIKKTNQ